MARKDESGNWMKPEIIESALNTPSDEGTPPFFSVVGTSMYYTHTRVKDSLEASYPAIYVSQRSGGSWGAGTKIELNRRDSSMYMLTPPLSVQTEISFILYRICRRIWGGKDIWRASMVGDLVEYVENLGPEINTAGDEMFPYLRNDSTLYFSSDGHVGMGGLDIYKASYHSRTEKWSVENMKYPVNSFADDFGITFEGEKERGFFSSNRGDAKGYDHIYSFDYPVIKTVVEGYIVDTDDEFVTKSTIRIVGRDGTNKRFPGKNDGSYSLDVNQGVNYVFLASAENFLNTRMSLKTVEQEKDSVYLVDFILTPDKQTCGFRKYLFRF